MANRRRALILVITGLIAAIAASLVIYYLITNIPKTPEIPQVTVPTPVPQREVLVALTDIAANSVITSSQIKTASFPEDMVPDDAITNTESVFTATVKTAIFSGQILLQRQFIAGPVTSIIPPGKVLVAFPSTDMLNATGAVQPGDHVDIMISLPISGTTRLDAGASNGTQIAPGATTLVSQLTLQNIEVYTMGEWTPPGQAANANGNGNANANPQALKIITFIVDHQEALILKFVKDSGGTIDLAIRSAQDNQNVDTDPVTIDYLVDLYKFIGLITPKR